MGFVSPNRNKYQTGGLRHLQARHILAEADFVCDGDGQLMVDRLGRFETLGTDARAIFTRIGLSEARPPHVTRSERAADYRTYCDAGTRGRVAETYARDIALFGYTF